MQKGVSDRRAKHTKMMKGGVEVTILPENACCLLEEECASPLDMDECPEGRESCDGDCFYYSEENFERDDM